MRFQELREDSRTKKAGYVLWLNRSVRVLFHKDVLDYESSPKTRYLRTGISLALALASSHGDGDARDGGDVGGNTSNRVAGGAGGFKLVRIALGAIVHSQPLGMAMGAYGASTSVYTHFIARGRDVVLPKNTAMEIAIGTRADVSPKSAEQ